jgi:hypothetical protein
MSSGSETIIEVQARGQLVQRPGRFMSPVASVMTENRLSSFKRFGRITGDYPICMKARCECCIESQRKRPAIDLETLMGAFAPPCRVGVLN